MDKINKSQARKRFEEGKIIYLLPSKISLQTAEHSPWFSLYKVKKDDYLEDEQNFDKIVNSFEYYNCNNETGRRAAYYYYK